MSRRGSAIQPPPTSRTSWRDVPQRAVTLPALGWLVLGALLLICFGLLLGASWTTQAMQPKLRQQAEERRRLNQEWVELRQAQRRLQRCPRCNWLLIRRNWYLTASLVDDPRDDD